MLPPLSNDDALRFLTVHYAEPHRFYHGTWHLIDVMRVWEMLARDRLWQHPLEAGLALAFHDAHYDPLGNVNEETSAGLAMDACRRYPADAGRVRDLILATKHHADGTEFDDPDTNLLMDVDIVNIGRTYEWFEWARHAIRMEYPTLSDFSWINGTCGFFEAVLAKERIYRRPDVVLRGYRLDVPGSTEASARANLSRGLQDLRG